MSQPDVTPIDPLLGAALGRLPSGLFVLTTRWAERDTGLLVSWVQQAGFEPPSVTVALRRDRFVAEWVERSGRLVLNQLGRGEKGLIRHFARGFEPEDDPFDGLAIERSAAGGVRLKTALAFLEAEVAGVIDSGDHRIFLGRVIDGAVLRDDNEPAVHLRRNGLHY